MSEQFDSFRAEKIRVDTELPTAEGPNLHARQLVANRYEILAQLGKGGMGEVWHAFDVKLRVDVALKSLRLDIKRNDNAVEALRREVRTAREVISPNVCRIFDLVVEENSELISMEYIDGITLTAMLIKKAPLDLQQARDIAAQFLAGLEAIHQAGLVHRDFKPENIMITRTGRVVVMDFGIAKAMTQAGGTISGTPPYMSPEQLAGEKLDARSDVYSAGVVLAEMIHPQGVFSQKTREEVWMAVRKDPLQLPESPWKAVITRAVAQDPANRFASAGALTRALEEVTQRVETIEERKPYPGLASFSAADAEYFFGRELEVETLIKKLQQLHLMALIGPSGAGKTSFLRAGLIPALLEGWSHIFCTPGDAPLVNLGQSLVPSLSGDVEAMQKMVRLQDSDTALWLLNRWKETHPQSLLIVDRFEELFTLNNSETQNHFAELLGRAAIEGNIRVLLAMRDDFLFQCHNHAALAPIFSELTPLGPLSGAALRRALVQPALKAGYRFEDESLVDEILADVQAERGALPLMAFAAARLWEKRDRNTGLLTRQTYKEIGGVAGALAQHAEQTMERIGTERQPIVREIFRNLITAQNTRAARDIDDLLSVFQSDSARASAKDVLRILIDARLLTSFEQHDEKGTRSRVEIIHESLLSNWPRLVRWQTQDADSAQLRDQLRQAAQLWEQRNRSQDLLWTGTAYLEFQAWRQRYQGGLTTSEEAFASAMNARATKRRRQRRIVVAAIFVILFGVLAVISIFWRGEKTARKHAVSEAQRAEASKLLAFGQLHVESYPTAALAYAIKSLELADTMEARMFALRITQQAPVAIIMPANQEDGLEAHRVDFSPDGKWIAIGGYLRTQVRSSDGKGPILMSKYSKTGSVVHVQFGPAGDRVFTDLFGDIRICAIPSGKEIGRWSVPSTSHSWIYRSGKGFCVIASDGLKSTIYYSPDQELEPRLLGEIPLGPMDIKGVTLIHTDIDHKKVYARSLTDWNAPRLVLQAPKEIMDVDIHPEGKQFAWTDASGQVRIWSIDPVSGQPIRILQAPNLNWLRYDESGNRLLAGGLPDGRLTFYIWDLKMPQGSAPLVLTRTDAPHLNGLSFHPSGNWMASASAFDVALWPLPSVTSRVLTGHGRATSIDVAFSSDGRSLFSASGDGTVRTWPLFGSSDDQPRILLKDSFQFPRIAIDPVRKHFAVTARSGRVLVANLDGTELLTLEGYSSDAWLMPVAFSPSGRLVVTGPFRGPKDDKVLRIWDLDSGKVRIIGPLPGAEEGFKGGVFEIKFIDESKILVSGLAGMGLRLFDLESDSNRILSNKVHLNLAISRDRSFAVGNACDDAKDESTCRFAYINLQNGERTVLQPYGEGGPVALDPTNHIVVTRGNLDGLLRVGKISDQEPHIFFGYKGIYNAVTVSPNGRWIASTGDNGKILITPMPDLSKPAPHTLPHDQFLAKLKAFTNLRVVADSKSSTGWKLETGPFPGWGKAPGW
jgi:serine/threonine protein kinase/WD40 repeat protein